MAYKIYICGGDYSNLDKREDCPNPLHDWPLPRGYVDAGEVAARRIAYRWSNRQCRKCNIWGWEPGELRESTNPIQVKIMEMES